MKTIRKMGFSLVELLIVLAILVVLAGVLFPVLYQARLKTWQAVCASNQRQNGMALGLYLQDYNETYPNFRFQPLGSQWPLGSQTAGDMDKNSWRSVIAPYQRGSEGMVCPANPDARTPSMDPKFKISYAANMALNPRDYPTLPPALDATGSGLFGKDLSPGVKAASVVQPAECIAVVEIFRVPDSIFVVDISTDNDRDFRVYADCLFTGHFGLTNYLFADGHVKALKPTATYHGDEVNYWYRDATPLGAEARITLAEAAAR